jgi:hypothetical protein
MGVVAAASKWARHGRHGPLVPVESAVDSGVHKQIELAATDLAIRVTTGQAITRLVT